MTAEDFKVSDPELSTGQQNMKNQGMKICTVLLDLSNTYD